ncbi:MAG: hypothetical protein M1828_001021 [Chrysothrix sp. TS-e1954]|nr:MAG: hypothetical protein M1828_001021 [Chrysothrix sp. TS-e1954]
MLSPNQLAGITLAFLSLLFILQTQFQYQSSHEPGWSWQACLPKYWRLDWKARQLQWSTADSQSDEYLLGVGKADITGPSVEINFMGFADPKQVGSGIRQRLYSRAFIVADPVHPKDRFVYLVLDTQSGDTAIRHGILQGLQELGPDYEVYTRSNVAVTGTHSHSGPGAWLNYLLPQITSKGFDKQSYEAIVTGAIRSIERAHRGLEPGRLSYDSAVLTEANVNRSPFAYLANPSEERARYEHDVDKTITMLRFTRSRDGKHIGALNWFPVHGTSMLGNNTLVTGDNKGIAAYLLERDSRIDEENFAENFVAGFSQSNVGDTSPNIEGAYCEDGSGEQCSFEASLCGGKSQPCHGRGPFFGLDDAGTKSCFEIGKRQFEAAKHILRSMQSRDRTGTPVRGEIRSLHTFNDMSAFTFTLPNGSTASTCPAALGYSFAAGTTDGPGAFDFKQNSSGDPNANPLWASVRNFIHEPSEEQKACHYPKPILLDVGETTSPYLWTPNIVDMQLLRVGPLIIIVSPGEATTMAGRRWKEAIADTATSLDLDGAGFSKPLVVLGGPANTYTHYIATEEEYGVQRYEGASTLYGPHTLNAYINATTHLVPYLSSFAAPKHSLDPGPDPPVNSNSSLTFINPVVYDTSGFRHSFGDVVRNVDPAEKRMYRIGESVSATFIGANPRNDLRLEGTYAEVQRVAEHSIAPVTVATDEDWDLVFTWRRTNQVVGTSEVTITWKIPEEVDAGRYRLVYHGNSKALGTGQIRELAPLEPPVLLRAPPPLSSILAQIVSSRATGPLAIGTTRVAHLPQSLHTSSLISNCHPPNRADFDNEINALRREYTKQQPDDVLQYCANYFLKRLESQRLETRLAKRHPSSRGLEMDGTSFPGSNPFDAGPGNGMNTLSEEDDHPGSPTSKVQETIAPMSKSGPPAAASSAFGHSEFAGERFSATGAMDGTHSLPQGYNFSRRTSVSAESMNPADSASSDWTPPVHYKSPEQEGRLRQAVAPNFLFSHLDEDQTKQVLGALQEKNIPAKGIKVISQGDVGDYFYIVEKGNFDIYVNASGKLETGADGMGKKVADIGPGGSFGELALMYNAPRAATVVSTDSSTLWALDRVTFRRIIMDSAFQRRQMYEAFLAEVPLLESLTTYERSKIADALNTQKFPPGQTIIQEGDIGENFYLLESGEAQVFKRGQETAVHQYKKGDYFGELALLDDKPRAASVVSKTDVKLATLGKDGFQRLMGPVADIMRRNDPSRMDTEKTST